MRNVPWACTLHPGASPFGAGTPTTAAAPSANRVFGHHHLRIPPIREVKAAQLDSAEEHPRLRLLGLRSGHPQPVESPVAPHESYVGAMHRARQSQRVDEGGVDSRREEARAGYRDQMGDGACGRGCVFQGPPAQPPRPGAALRLRTRPYADPWWVPDLPGRWRPDRTAPAPATFLGRPAAPRLFRVSTPDRP